MGLHRVDDSAVDHLAVDDAANDNGRRPAAVASTNEPGVVRSIDTAPRAVAPRARR